MPSAITTNFAAPQAQSSEVRRSAGDSPLRPPVSPITPVASLAELDPPLSNATPLPQPTFIQRPAAVPISESENADAVALRAAISVLQIQKEKSKRDIQTLQQLKEAAAQEPETFAQELVEGRLKHDQSSQDPLRATFETSLETRDDDDDGEKDDGDGDNDGSENHDSDDEDMDDGSESQTTGRRFPKIPSAQNVFRCPPVNWAKYQIVGDRLDKMHEEQRLRPTPGEPLRGEASAQAHAVAAPYSPFHDKIGDQPQPKITAKKPN